MSEEIPATPPEPTKPGPMPRWVVIVALVAVLGFMGYSATHEDYKSMIVSALVVLFILGADIGAILRNWRGGGG